MKKKLKDLALFLEQLRSHFICIEYVQIDNVEEQRKIKEDLIQNTEEVEKVLAIREEMDAKQELKSKYAKRSVETTSGVERLQLRVAIEKLEEEVYELREMLLQSKLDAELLLEKDLKKKLKISKMCERLLSSLKNQYEQLNEEKRELRAVYDTKVKAVAAEDISDIYFFPKSISEFDAKEMNVMVNNLQNKPILRDKLIFCFSIRANEGSRERDMEKTEQIIGALKRNGFHLINPTYGYTFYRENKGIIAYDNSYVYPQEAYDYIVSLNEKCGSYIKNGANCGEDCIQYLNRKPTTKTGNIYYRIIELERN